MTRAPYALLALAAAAAAAGSLLLADREAPPPRPDAAAHETQRDAARLTAARRARVAAMAEDWPGTPHYRYAVDALAAAPVRDMAGGARFEEADAYWGLPRTPGYEAVATHCAGCHSLRLVMQQQATAERWRALLRWMTEKQGMPPLAAEEEAALIAYLARHFGAD